ncbi:hypothetical protein H181DRAFT_01179 [Streptomyces sp. WMMB 714]|uniref:hypothetical protein n=1 Tax=Streptomyces sp. WMMB 714 TaxID=1286822 RepID=UPI0005F86BF4|nr:hypothetical protein [Streptomyces sp. WMMB 714]SCK17501.1 hypothetical protein H181DRAFT_01179 [Streptomyces sp. WMMB 714]
MSIGMLFVALVLLAGLTWMVGSAALRIGGWLMMASSVLGIAGALGYGAGFGVFGVFVWAVGFLFGMAVWLGGHWLFAFKNHYFKSGLAQRALLRLGDERLDPTRNWAIPVHDPHQDSPYREGPYRDR